MWHDVVARAWAEAGRLHDLRRVIAALTATDTLHVKLLDVWSWSDFLHCLIEDVSSSWVREVLYAVTARNVVTRDTLKELLALADPGVEVAGGMLVALAGPRMYAMCFNFQNCGSWALVA